MAMRAWRVWAAGVVLAGAMALAKPPDLPGKPDVDGKVPAPLTQEHYQVEAAPAPRLLPLSILSPKPVHGPLTADADFQEFVASLASDPDHPIQKVGFDGGTARTRIEYLKVRAAFEQAESHFDACEPHDARPWYLEVIRLAPTSIYAKTAAERLQFGKVFPAGPQSREPPFAESPTEAVAVPRMRIP
jgi:hypothetical protein